MAKESDGCTGFFSNWFSYTQGRFRLKDCCEIHDQSCSSKRFWACLWKNKVVGGTLIWAIASLACLIRHGEG